MTLEQAVQVVVQNTIAVLTSVPEKKDEWWETLGQLQRRARAQGGGEFSAFLGLLQRLVEGTSPAALAAQVPPEFRQAWEAIVRGIMEQKR